MNTPTTSPKLTTSAMIASFADPGQKTTSAPFGHALARLADERPEIVGLSADLAKYTPPRTPWPRSAGTSPFSILTNPARRRLPTKSLSGSRRRP
jgi:hypothetical protein